MSSLEKQIELLARSRGRVSRSAEVGRECEIAAAELLRSQGYRDLSLSGGGRGPDITATDPSGNRKTFEVKAVSPTGGGQSWVITRISRHRMQDDFILIVLPNGKIFQECMADHLKQCGSGGSRTVTQMVRLHWFEWKKYLF
jgi:hypothetical protein